MNINAVHKDTKSSHGKCFFFLPSLFSSGVHFILWAHSTSHSRLCLLICGFYITRLQVRVESSYGHRRSPGEAYAHPCPQEHALSSCSQPGCMCQPGQAFDKLRSNQITVFSYFTDTRHVTDLSQRVKAYAAFFHLAINMYGITSPL